MESKAQIVYNNIHKMMTYHKLKANPPTANLSGELMAKEYIIVQGEGERPVTVIMIAPNSEYASKTGSFKKLMTQIENSDKDYERKRTIIVSDGLSRNITKALPTIPSHPESYHYDIFMTEVPKHRCHYLHDGQFVFERLPTLPAELVARFVTLSSLPKIPTSSPLAVWCGLQRGDIFMYDALSETSGVEKIIRLVE